LHDGYVCGMCHVPSRAGKTRKALAASTGAAAQAMCIAVGEPHGIPLPLVAAAVHSARQPRAAHAA
jgi:hypothetical protein